MNVSKKERVKIRTKLQNARKGENLTQKKVASVLGITKNGYQAIEYGTRGTSEDNWLKLFELFEKKFQLQELMKNDRDDTANIKSGRAGDTK